MVSTPCTRTTTVRTAAWSPLPVQEQQQLGLQHDLHSPVQEQQQLGLQHGLHSPVQEQQQLGLQHGLYSPVQEQQQLHCKKSRRTFRCPSKKYLSDVE
jgi:hypothetical protein